MDRIKFVKIMLKANWKKYGFKKNVFKVLSNFISYLTIEIFNLPLLWNACTT